MGKITLQVGEPITLTVTGAETVEGNYGPQVKLESDEGTLYLSETTAQQQLGRLGLTPQSVVGQAITVEKVAKNGKTYTNINRAQPAPAVSPRTPQPFSAGPALPWEQEQVAAEQRDVAAIQQGATHAERMGKLAKLYAECLIIASDNVPKALEPHGVKPTAEAIVAATATLFIQANQRGMAA